MADLAAFTHAQQVIDALPRPLVITDRVGAIVGWNRAAERLFGWPAESVLGTLAQHAIRSADGRADGEAVISGVLGGSNWEGELRVRTASGRGRSLFALIAPLRDAGGEIVGTVGIIADVTDGREAERRAADLSEHLQLALDAGDLGTFRWDLASGIVTWDERLERLFGLAPGTFDGNFATWRGLLHPEDRDQVLEAIDAAVRSKGSYLVEHRVVHPDGSMHWLQGRGRVTIGADGSVTGTIGCTADITATKALELEAHIRADVASLVAQRERTQRERIEFLTGLTKLSIAASDHAEFIASVTAAAVPRLGDWCSLHFIPEPGAAMESRVAHADPAKVAWAESLSERYPFDPAAVNGPAAVMRTGEPEFIPVIDDTLIDRILAARDDAADIRPIVESMSLTSAITVPLTTKRGVIGAMQFVSAESRRRYDADDLALAQATAGRVAEALENLWVTDEHRRISVVLQQSLLPPAVPAIEGLDVAVRYWPAGEVSEVGGDFYDVFSMGDDMWGVLIGDVCGSGPDAAAVSGIVRHTVRAAARHGQDPETVLHWINEAVLQSGRNLFCTSNFSTLQPRAGGFRMTTTSGGHPLPFIASPDGSVRQIGTAGSVLGAFDEIHVSTCDAELVVGDTLVLYTDGITDLPPPDGISPEDLAELIRSAASSVDAEGVADAIHEALAARMAPDHRPDDVALVIARCQTAP